MEFTGRCPACRFLLTGSNLCVVGFAKHHEDVGAYHSGLIYRARHTQRRFRPVAFSSLAVFCISSSVEFTLGFIDTRPPGEAIACTTG